MGQQPFGGPGLQVGGASGRWVSVGGASGRWGFRLVGLSWWGYKWMRLQVGVTPLDKLSVVVPPVTANAAQTEV